MTAALLEALQQGVRVYDLAQPMQVGMPQSPNHPRFHLSLARRHGDHVRHCGGSSANEVIFTGGHVGTHIDALCHVSQDGHLHGDVDATAAQTGGLFQQYSIDTVDPIVCRGVLLDIPALLGVEVLEPGYEITARDLERAADRQGIEVQAGDAVLIRSGWPRHWPDPEVFVGQRGGVPGPGEAAAEWLAARKIRVAGGETIAYEVIRPGQGHSTLPVHRIFLVDHGIHIIETMNLGNLARDGHFEFVFMAAPLKLVGATGSPLRPLGVVSC